MGDGEACSKLSHRAEPRQVDEVDLIVLVHQRADIPGPPQRGASEAVNEGDRLASANDSIANSRTLNDDLASRRPNAHARVSLLAYVECFT